MKRKRRNRSCFIWIMVLTLALPPWIFAQGTTGASKFKQEELDQMLAPIALYPDSLLGQVLIASTYPLEIVQADRWTRANKNLKGDPLTAALEKQNWDPSVKSLVNFPQVLSMMSEKLDWTQKVGDAFLAQQKEVMDTIQKLRFKAKESGNLKTTKEQKVTVQEKVVIIEPVSPQVIYVPAYNPTVVYGAWPYPAYPPYPVYPPGYVATTAAFSFAAGVAVGAAWGYAWSNCNWNHGDVNINVHQNNNINNNINRDKYSRPGQGGSGTWQHDPDHRKGVSYKDQTTAQKYNKGGSSEAAKNREAFRGHSDQGGQGLSRSGGDRTSGMSGNRGGSGQGGRDNAFGGLDRGSSQVAKESSRGQNSREGMGGHGGTGSMGGSHGGAGSMGGSHGGGLHRR